MNRLFYGLTQEENDGYGGLPIVRGAEARQLVAKWRATPKWTVFTTDESEAGPKIQTCTGCGVKFKVKTFARKYCEMCRGKRR